MTGVHLVIVITALVVNTCTPSALLLACSRAPTYIMHLQCADCDKFVWSFYHCSRAQIHPQIHQHSISIKSGMAAIEINSAGPLFYYIIHKTINTIFIPQITDNGPSLWGIHFIT